MFSIIVSTNTLSTKSILYSEHTVDILRFTIDTGKGTTKLMGRFVTSDQDRFVMNISLFDEARSIAETFTDLEWAFGQNGVQIQNLMLNGISVYGTFYKFLCIFVRDEKMYYAFMGMSAACRRFPCVWRQAPIRKMASNPKELTRTELVPRPEMKKTIEDPVGSHGQNPRTVNIFGSLLIFLFVMKRS